MLITAVYECTVCYEIEVPDGTPESECELLAGQWLDEHFTQVAESINEQEIDVKEVYL